MIFFSPYKPNEIIEILAEQIDDIPTFMQNLNIFKARRNRGTSRVCGTLTEKSFELRNRDNPTHSLKVFGKLTASGEGTKIEISFGKAENVAPRFPGRDRVDRRTVFQFLEEWIEILQIDSEEIDSSESQY